MFDHEGAAAVLQQGTTSHCTVRVKDIVYPSEEYGETMMHYTEYFSTEALAASGKNIYQVAYEYIKGLPEFEGATDI